MHHVHYTAANVTDVTQLDTLLHRQEERGCGDGGYTGAEKQKIARYIGVVCDCRLILCAVSPRARTSLGTLAAKRHYPGTSTSCAPVAGDQTAIWV